MPELWHFYLLLAASTAVVVMLAAAIWKRTGSAVFPLGVAFFYYWTLAGGWVIVNGKADATHEEHIYLYEKLFPIFLDNDYLWTLSLYAAFLISMELAVLHFTKPIHRASDMEPTTGDAIFVSHWRILLVCSFAWLISYWLVESTIVEATELGASTYAYVGKEAEHLSLHQLFNQAAQLPLAIGIAILLSGANGRYLVGSGTPAIALAYMTVAGATFGLNLILGQRGEIVVPLALVCIFYLVNCRRPRLALVGSLATAAILGLWVVTAGRNGFRIDAPSGAMAVESIFRDMIRTVSGIETVASHFSLYGAVHKGVPIVYGMSIVVLLLSAIPRALWPGRPSGVYEYYAYQVGAAEGQGYTIHHATGWYLNFGAVGVVLGAVFFGWVWSKLFNALSEPSRFQNQAWRILSAVGFATLTAIIPLVVRDGIEGYKAIVVEAFLMPTAILTFASVSLYRLGGRPTLVGWRVSYNRPRESARLASQAKGSQA